MHPIIQFGDYAGTAVFALSGGLAAAQKRLDIAGFVLLAFVTAVGGGTMRDLLLDRGEVFWVREPLYVILGVAPGVLVYFAADRVRSRERAIIWADAVGLAVFAVIGTGIAMQQQVSSLTAVLMGVLTASGGGVLRDVVRNEVPLLLKRELYAVAALAGSAVMVGSTRAADAAPGVAVAGGLLVAFGVRAAGIIWRLHLPAFQPRSD
ncbi:MAG: trimeric intracellular cation channel family protein [Phycisphaerales bacterium]|nr:trimeric intracellular cation channel family protein [Phycisphaerales bacterium]